MVFALIALATLAAVGSSALLVSGTGIQATRNYRGASQAHFVAESGLAEALQTVNGAVGVVNFNNDVVGHWDDFLGNGPRTFAASAGYTYTVMPIANAASLADNGWLRSTANGPEGARNVSVAQVVRSAVPGTSPGAIYLANDAPTDASFQGNAFLVDGNDHRLNGGPGVAPAVPGIATRNATNTGETIDSLGGGQRDNVIGQGYLPGPPVVPSVITSPAAPTVAQMQQIVADLLARPGVVTINDSSVNGNSTFGTIASPQITHFVAADGITIKGNGNASGAGILIVDADLTIQGTFDFVGLIIVAGATRVAADWETGLTGNATMYGSLWTQDLNLSVGGSAIAAYSSEGLALANTVSGGGALPAPLRVASLIDCAQVPTGANGCP